MRLGHHQPRLPQRPQVMRHGGLLRPGIRDEVAHAGRAVGEQLDDPGAQRVNQQPDHIRRG
jgi:hypothetical protein